MLDLESLEVEDIWQLLLPCSSCSTYTSSQLGSQNSRSSPQQAVTIILPNLIDRKTVTYDEISSFVEKTISPAEITMTHLIIYLFLVNSDPTVLGINNLKLLHMGRPYCVHLARDLARPLPSLAEVAAKFPTFQLAVCMSLAGEPIRMNPEQLLMRSIEVSLDAELPPAVTYAELMVRIFKKASRRKLSVASLETRRSRPTRTELNSSSTDVEEMDLGQKAKLHHSWKRIFRRHRVAH